MTAATISRDLIEAEISCLRLLADACERTARMARELGERGDDLRHESGVRRDSFLIAAEGLEKVLEIADRADAMEQHPSRLGVRG